jgi:hypothetical protein
VENPEALKTSLIQQGWFEKEEIEVFDPPGD